MDNMKKIKCDYFFKLKLIYSYSFFKDVDYMAKFSGIDAAVISDVINKRIPVTEDLKSFFLLDLPVSSLKRFIKKSKQRYLGDCSFPKPNTELYVYKDLIMGSIRWEQKKDKRKIFSKLVKEHEVIIKAWLFIDNKPSDELKSFFLVNYNYCSQIIKKGSLSIKNPFLRKKIIKVAEFVKKSDLLEVVA